MKRNFLLSLLFSCLAVTLCSLYAGAEGGLPPELFVKAQCGEANDLLIARYAYDNKIGAYRELATARLDAAPSAPSEMPEGSREVFGAGKYVFVREGNSITRFNRDLTRPLTRYFKRLGAVTVSPDGRLFLADDGYFIALNRDMNEQGRVQLTGAWKNAHDIEVLDGTAYVLDNVVMPLYVFVIDVANSWKLNIVRRFSIEGISAHLTSQWLEPGTDRWFIVESYHHEGGEGQNLHVHRMKDAREEPRKKALFLDSSMLGNDALAGATGTRIERAVQLEGTPSAAVLSGGTVAVPLYDEETGALSFRLIADNSVYERSPGAGPLLLRSAGRHLLLARRGTPLFMIVDPAGANKTEYLQALHPAVSGKLVRDVFGNDEVCTTFFANPGEDSLIWKGDFRELHASSTADEQKKVFLENLYAPGRPKEYRILDIYAEEERPAGIPAKPTR